MTSSNFSSYYSVELAPFSCKPSALYSVLLRRLLLSRALRSRMSRLADLLPLLESSSPKLWPQPRTRTFYNALRRKRSAAGTLAPHVKGWNERKKPRKPKGTEPVPAEVVTNAPFWTRFVKEETLGTGSFGTVYRARDTATGSMVAVKEIRAAKSSKEARNEAAMLQRLQGSPMVVRLLGFDDDCGDHDADYKTSCVVMSLCGGGDLEDFVQRNGPLNNEQLRAVAVEVGRLVQDCHAAGILHSDIKAANLMLTSLASQDLLRTNPKLLQPGWLVATDMGTARVARLGFSSRPLGTPTHWAPEVFGRRFTYPADLWSCGTMLFRLRFGRMPFWDAAQEGKFRSTSNILRQIMQTTPTWSTSDPLLDDFLQKLLNKDPSKRMTGAEVLDHPWVTME